MSVGKAASALRIVCHCAGPDAVGISHPTQDPPIGSQVLCDITQEEIKTRGTVSAIFLPHLDRESSGFYPGETIMADIKEKIEDAGDAVKDATKKMGEKIQEGADTVAEKTADAAKSAGQAMKDAGQKLKDKSGT